MEAGVGLLARGEGAGGAYALIAFDVVIAGDDEQAVFFDIRGFEEVVEEFSG